MRFLIVMRAIYPVHLILLDPDSKCVFFPLGSSNQQGYSLLDKVQLQSNPITAIP